MKIKSFIKKFNHKGIMKKAQMTSTIAFILMLVSVVVVIIVVAPVYNSFADDGINNITNDPTSILMIRIFISVLLLFVIGFGFKAIRRGQEIGG